MVFNVIVDDTTSCLSFVFGQSRAKFSAGFTSVSNPAVAAFDLVHCSPSVHRFVFVLDISKCSSLLPVCVQCVYGVCRNTRRARVTLVWVLEWGQSVRSEETALLKSSSTGKKLIRTISWLTVPGSPRVDLFSRLRNKPEELKARWPGRSQPGWEKRGDESFDEDPLNNKPIFGRRFTRRVWSFSYVNEKCVSSALQ